MKLSSEWHEAVANNLSGPEYDFSKPWYQAAALGTYEIIPITNSGELYREGYRMHHCVGTRANEVTAGRAYFYSVLKDKERAATLELIKPSGVAEVGELRGPCNGAVPKELRREVVKWLESQKKATLDN